MILSSDSDKIVRQEVAYHMKYLCMELEESYIRKNVLKVIDNYLNDGDIIIRTAMIVSILSTIPNKLNDEFIITNNANKIQYIFDTDSSNNDIQRTQIIIFKSLVNEINRYGNIEKNFNNLIKFFLTKHFLSREKTVEYNLPLNFLVEELYIIINLYKSNEINMVHEIVNLVINYIFEISAKQSKEDHIYQQIFKDLSFCFISNLCNVI